ncbi:MAG: transporter substrate-binding domain-containing protein [Bacteroidales bacterium]
MKRKKIIKLTTRILPVLLLFVILIILVPFGINDHEEEPEVLTDLEKIKERGYLRATTNFNSTNYFIYRGEPMGFHLELLKSFTQHIGVDLEIFVTNDISENFSCLLAEDECDVIALDLTVTKSRSELIEFTTPHSQTRQVLVQKKPEDWYNMRSSEIEDNLIRNHLDLAGKTVYVQSNSAFAPRLKHLMEEIGDTIYVVEVDMEIEQLIEKVSNGEIDYTVSDEHLANVNMGFYSNIDIQTPISFSQNLAWAVKKASPGLLEAVNEWLENFKSTRKYANLFNKYYNNPRTANIARSQFHSLGGGKISEYDDYFKRYAEQFGWDWRLLASVAYQESRFNPQAISWAGAFGVMQLMPKTAAIYNVNISSRVADNIRAGANYLHYLDDRFKTIIEDDNERLKFVLASYNVGIGHVFDARRLAEKFGKDPNVWKDNVDYYVLNKSKPKYYLDPVVRHGYCRGREPYLYVIEILERYEHYKNALDV